MTFSRTAGLLITRAGTRASDGNAKRGNGVAAADRVDADDQRHRPREELHRGGEPDRQPGPAEAVTGGQGEGEQAEREHRDVVAAGGQGQRAQRQHRRHLHGPDQLRVGPKEFRPLQRGQPRSRARTRSARRSTSSRRSPLAAARRSPCPAGTACTRARDPAGSRALRDRDRASRFRAADARTPRRRGPPPAPAPRQASTTSGIHAVATQAPAVSLSRCRGRRKTRTRRPRSPRRRSRPRNDAGQGWRCAR